MVKRQAKRGVPEVPALDFSTPRRLAALAAMNDDAYAAWKARLQSALNNLQAVQAVLTELDDLANNAEVDANGKKYASRSLSAPKKRPGRLAERGAPALTARQLAAFGAMDDRAYAEWAARLLTLIAEWKR